MDWNVSKTFISECTNKLIPAIREWQNRPLDNCYYCLDGLYLF
ncbi:MAG: transposase [Saprospiraceae bacterium]|nr:transposase [Saprospiraceae bacterium]